METVLHTSNRKYELEAPRNDSAWVENETLAKHNDVDAVEGDVTYKNASTSPPVRDDDTTSISTDFWEDEVDFGVHDDPATPSSLFNRAARRKRSHADGCISPRTTKALTGDPPGTLNQIYGIEDPKVVAAGQRKASLQLLRSYSKGEAGGATVGITRNSHGAKDIDMRVEDAEKEVCVEEFHWRRGKSSRLLSYQDDALSSRDDDDGDGDSSSVFPNAGCDSDSSERWIFSEDSIIPAGFESREGCHGLMVRNTGLQRMESNKSRKFVKKKRKKRTSDDTHRTSMESAPEAKMAGAARPLRHSYGATLDLSPMGVQSHRNTTNSEGSVNEAVHEEELVMLEDLGQVEALLDHNDEPLSTFQKCMTVSLLVVANVVLLGSSLACILWLPVWNGSKFAVRGVL